MRDGRPPLLPHYLVCIINHSYRYSRRCSYTTNQPLTAPNSVQTRRVVDGREHVYETERESRIEQVT